MADPAMTMPIAVPDTGIDPATYYTQFADNLDATYTEASGLLISVADDPTLARLYAPIKSAMRFAPAGTEINGTALATDSLLLATWPTTFPAAKTALGASAPAQLRFENVDAAEVRAAVTPIYQAIGKGAEALDAFLAGNGALRVQAGDVVGLPATDAGAPPTTPRQMRLLAYDGAGVELNAVQFLSDLATH